RGLLRRREGLRVLGLRRRGVRGLTVIRFWARRTRWGGTGLRILIGLEGPTAAVEEDAGIGGDPRVMSVGDGDVLQRGVVEADADALPAVEFDRMAGVVGLADSVSCGEGRRRGGGVARRGRRRPIIGGLGLVRLCGGSGLGGFG